MNTDWNSPQGDFDTAEKQGELLMLLSRQQVTVHTWDDPDFDYMEEQDLALVVQSPSSTEDLLIELCGEFSVFFEKWHGEYAATAEGYAQLQQDWLLYTSCSRQESFISINRSVSYRSPPSTPRKSVMRLLSCGS